MPRVLLTVTLAILSTAAQGKLRPSSVTKPKTMPPTTDSFKIRASTTVELPKSFSEDGNAGLDECFKQRYRYDSRFFVSGSVVLEERYDQVLTRSNTFDKAAYNISTGFEKEFRGTFKKDCTAEYTDYTNDGYLYMIKCVGFCDVDENKIQRGYHNPRKGIQLPVIHFRDVKPPLLICVAMGRTGGELEKNIASLGLKEVPLLRLHRVQRHQLLHGDLGDTLRIICIRATDHTCV